MLARCAEHCQSSFHSSIWPVVLSIVSPAFHHLTWPVMLNTVKPGPLLPAGITYFFACQRWFSLGKDDGLIERDLYPSEEDPHGQLCSYLAEVHTSTAQGAGTDADVSLMLFGDLGDSGLQPLNVGHLQLCCFLPSS